MTCQHITRVKNSPKAELIHHQNNRITKIFHLDHYTPQLCCGWVYRRNVWLHANFVLKYTPRQHPIHSPQTHASNLVPGTDFPAVPNCTALYSIWVSGPLSLPITSVALPRPPPSPCGWGKGAVLRISGRTGQHGPTAGLCEIAAGGRTLEKLDEEIESVNNTLEIMSDPTTLKNIKEEAKGCKKKANHDLWRVSEQS